MIFDKLIFLFSYLWVSSSSFLIVSHSSLIDISFVHFVSFVFFMLYYVFEYVLHTIVFKKNRGRLASLNHPLTTQLSA